MRLAVEKRVRFALLACGTILAGLIFLGSMTTAAPSPGLADEIDRLLDQDSCIGSIDQWPSRYYAWGRNSWSRFDHPLHPLPVLGSKWLGSDKSVVKVRLYQGAWPGDYPPGRHLLRADQANFPLDSSDIMFAAGTYDVRSRRLTDWTCGPNNG